MEFLVQWDREILQLVLRKVDLKIEYQVLKVKIRIKRMGYLCYYRNKIFLDIEILQLSFVYFIFKI